MHTQNKNFTMYWILFFISTIAFLAAIFLHWEWLTLIIPFVGTFFAKAMDLID